MKQTAVDWLVEQLNQIGFHTILIENTIEQARAMEKEQMKVLYTMHMVDTRTMELYDFDEYYNETYIQTHTPKYYRVWFPDIIEAAGGFWWHAVTDSCGRLYDPKHPNGERDSVQWYIDNGYKIEEVTNG